MLSRDAEACYWIGRYVERAEATARMVDVHYHTALETFLPYAAEGPVGSEELNTLGWQPILAISGNAADYAKRYDKENDRDVLHFFAFDYDNPDSIISTWTKARENSRSIRELISSEMWEAINISYIELRSWDVDQVLKRSPHEFFYRVKNAAHLFQGILGRTMMLGEARDWLDIGTFLERAFQTARLLDVKYHDLLPGTLYHSEEPSDLVGVDDPYGVGGPLDTHGWTAVLKSVSAFEMFCKTHRNGINPTNVVDFLLLNAQFPASVRHGVDRVEASLRNIAVTAQGAPVSDPERQVGRLQAELMYNSSREIIEHGLHQFLVRVLAQCNTIGGAISRAYLS
ncbi:MAG: alpha-E domain-containing protein [Capsulimonadaceae bacterium]|nr:alpha-E domain-containing protein [Capsulimonadaceae bacterium]